MKIFFCIFILLAIWVSKVWAWHGNHNPEKVYTLSTDSDVSHLCHMGSVYVQTTHYNYLDDNKTKSETLSILWNYDKSEPLRCQDYKEYIEKLKADYLTKGVHEKQVVPLKRKGRPG